MKALNLTVELWNEFCEMQLNGKLPHPDDMKDLRHHLHAIQNLLISNGHPMASRFEIDLMGAIPNVTKPEGRLTRY